MSIIDARRGACLDIALFGSSVLSSYGNGVATYYRGLLKALHARGHRVTFFEPDAFGRQRHRDIADPAWARVVVYNPTEHGVMRQLDSARSADVIIKAGDIGLHDELLERAVLDLSSPAAITAFWDVAVPTTLDTIESDSSHRLRALLPRYDKVFTLGGGQPAVDRYRALGVRNTLCIHPAVDPETHYPTLCDARFDCHMAFMGDRRSDRQESVERLLIESALALPDRSFVIGGNGWDAASLPGNVRQVGHIYTSDHNAFNSTPLALLNVARRRAAECGFAPCSRLFEAAGAGACILAEDWEGIEEFFEPGEEFLVVDSTESVIEELSGLDRARAKDIGRRARGRVLSEHTYDHRALLLEESLMGRRLPPAQLPSRLSFVAQRRDAARSDRSES